MQIDPEMMELLSRLGVSKDRMDALKDQRKQVGLTDYQAPEGQRVGPSNLYVAPTGMNYLASVAENVMKKRQAAKLDERMNEQMGAIERDRNALMSSALRARQPQLPIREEQGIPYDPRGMRGA